MLFVAHMVWQMKSFMLFVAHMVWQMKSFMLFVAHMVWQVKIQEEFPCVENYLLGKYVEMRILLYISECLGLGQVACLKG